MKMHATPIYCEKARPGGYRRHVKAPSSMEDIQGKMTISSPDLLGRQMPSDPRATLRLKKHRHTQQRRKSRPTHSSLATPDHHPLGISEPQHLSTPAPPQHSRASSAVLPAFRSGTEQSELSQRIGVFGFLLGPYTLANPCASSHPTAVDTMRRTLCHPPPGRVGEPPAVHPPTRGIGSPPCAGRVSQNLWPGK
jgi:hypothetical protein